MFWTARLPDGSAQIDLEDRTASLDVEDLEIPDFGDVVHALTGGNGKPIAEGTVSFHMRWSGGKGPRRDSDEETFEARVSRGTADLEWSASEPGFDFESTATTKVNFAEIGRERNGVFFNGDDDD